MGFKMLALLICFSGALFAKPLTKIRLGLNWKAEPEFGGFYAAQELGIYKKAGFDVEIIEGSANIPIVPMVESQQAHFGISSGDHLILHRKNGGDVKALFTVYQKSPQCVMVREDSAIKSIRDLMNSDFTLSSSAGIWINFLKKKYSPKKLKVVPYHGGITAYLSDPKFAQQCYAGSEPELAQAQGVKTRTLLIADDGFDNYAAVMFATGKYIKENPEITKKFVAASIEGWKTYLKDPSAAHKKISQLNSAMDPKTVEAVFRVQKPLMEGPKGTAFGQFNLKRWSVLIDQMRGLGLVKDTVKPEELFIEP